MKLPVLVVDDDAYACHILARLLSARGYQADIAHEGRSALALVDRRNYGLAILDYEMPGMNGVDLFRRIRQARPDLAAVFVTAHADSEITFPSVEAGVLRVFPKPVDFNELMPIIDEQVTTTD